MWTIAPAVLLAVVAVPTVKTIFDLAKHDPNALEVTVIGQQWWWEFDYPAIKNADGQAIVTANEMVIPAGKPVELSITRRDVIHSFWIPRLNGKRDAVPEPRPAAAHRGRPARRVLGPVHRVLRPVPRQHAHARSSR